MWSKSFSEWDGSDNSIYYFDFGDYYVRLCRNCFMDLSRMYQKYIQSLKEVFVNLMDISNLQYVKGKFLFPQLFVHYKETIIIF